MYYQIRKFPKKPGMQPSHTGLGSQLPQTVRRRSEGTLRERLLSHKPATKSYQIRLIA